MNKNISPSELLCNSSDQLALNRLFLASVENSEKAIVVLDDKLIILFANKVASRFFSLAVDELIGRPLPWEEIFSKSKDFEGGLEFFSDRFNSWLYVNFIKCERFVLLEIENTNQKYFAHNGAYEWRTNPAGKRIFFNDSWLQFRGETSEMEMLSDGLEGIHEEDLLFFQETFNNAFHDKREFQLEYRIQSKDGNYAWVLDNGKPVYDAKNNFLGFVGFCTDITDRKLTEFALRSSQNELMDFFESAPVGLQWVDEDGNIIWANATQLEMLGYSYDEYIGHKISDFCQNKQILLEVLNKLKNYQSAHNYEMELKTKDGSLKSVLVSSNAFFEGDKFLHTRCFIRDITERKQAEEEIKKQSNYFKFLAESIPQIVWTAEPSGMADYSNSKWDEYTGLTLEESKGLNWMKVLHPDDVQKCKEAWEKAKKEGCQYQVEYRFRRASDGQYRWHLGRALPLKNEKGEVLKWFGTTTDIDDQKKVEQKILESAESFKHLAESMPQMVWMTFPNGQNEYFNKRWFEYSGCTYEESYLSEEWKKVIHPDFLEACDKLIAEATREKKNFEMEYLLRRADGEYRWHLGRAVPMLDANGNIIKWFGTATDIHDQKMAHVLIKQSAEHYRFLAESIPQMVWTANADGAVDYFNKRWTEFTGLSLEDSLDFKWRSALHPSDVIKSDEAWSEASKTESVFEIEYRFKNQASGSYNWFLGRGIPLKNSEGKIVKWFGTCTDIDFQKRAEESIKRSAEEFRILAESLPQIVWTANGDGDVNYFNKCWYCYTGLTEEESLGDAWLTALHPDDYRRCMLTWEEAFKDGRTYRIEYRFKRRDGKYKWFLDTGIPLKDENGKILKWFGTTTDIDEQKTAEESFKHSAETFKLIAEAIPQIVWTALPDGTLDYMNPRWTDYTGLSMEEFLDQGQAVVVHPADFESVANSWSTSLINKEPFEHEFRMKRFDGVYRWQLGRGVPIISENGEVLKWFGTTTDIDDQKRAEERIAQSEAKFRRLVDSNIIGVFVARIDGAILEANQAFLNMIDYSSEDVVAGRLNWINLTPEEERKVLFERREKIMKEGVLTPFEKEYIRKDGSLVPVVVGVARLEGSVDNVVAFVLDVTERKEIEKRKDEFIGMASHELKTPVTSTKVFTQILLKMFEKHEDQKPYSYLLKMNEQIDKLTKLITDLLDISKIQKGRLELKKDYVNLSKFVFDLVENYQLSVETHKIKFFAETEETICCDKARLEQVVINLLSNAVKYSPQASLIEVRVYTNKDNAIVSVKDFGIGIPKEHQDKIFKRFYRVFEGDERTFPGLGVGLYISAEIIRLHEGKIWVESSKGQGTNISFALPKFTTECI